MPIPHLIWQLSLTHLWTPRPTSHSIPALTLDLTRHTDSYQTINQRQRYIQAFFHWQLISRRTEPIMQWLSHKHKYWTLQHLARTTHVLPMFVSFVRELLWLDPCSAHSHMAEPQVLFTPETNFHLSRIEQTYCHWNVAVAIRLLGSGRMKIRLRCGHPLMFHSGTTEHNPAPRWLIPSPNRETKKKKQKMGEIAGSVGTVDNLSTKRKLPHKLKLNVT